MIQPVEKKYCIGNLVQVMPNTEACHLIVSVDEIILLRVGDRILVNMSKIMLEYICRN